ncbi:hypothetical protein BDK51DRAFT_45129 [Blyttiomyces helicus]|uniref:Uncharacterized protein n=1 Tax=Blyttiomyces helicus TaxID=388810 RepID=A0A4V1ISL8_9FUNG|nr:hypothetical protein BDK51DRAFT_45129 [Blyttiomyces helicus]|eukprot:RKO94007.1 hypothetical protein BDK51DRAFT_45129 [Blyttiomyces helicus]
MSRHSETDILSFADIDSAFDYIEQTVQTLKLETAKALNLAGTLNDLHSTINEYLTDSDNKQDFLIALGNALFTEIDDLEIEKESITKQIHILTDEINDKQRIIDSINKDIPFKEQELEHLKQTVMARLNPEVRNIAQAVTESQQANQQTELLIQKFKQTDEILDNLKRKRDDSIDSLRRKAQKRNNLTGKFYNLLEQQRGLETVANNVQDLVPEDAFYDPMEQNIDRIPIDSTNTTLGSAKKDSQANAALAQAVNNKFAQDKNGKVGKNRRK